MTFNKNFCPSPWFHMRINNSGCYEACRWFNNDHRNTGKNINNSGIEDFFQKDMQQLRQDMLAGKEIPGCIECRITEKHNKISGRHRQLLKIGVTEDQFEKKILSSPWADQFSTSNFNLLPQDWQIDLGNYCDSACVFCVPRSSSRLEMEFKKLKIKTEPLSKNWCNNPEHLQKFLSILKKSPSVRYLHFIGGETIITPAFKIILKDLIESGIGAQLSIGFTTNLNCWDQEVVDLLTEFKEVNLGVSIECVDKLNDYVRWPSDIEKVMLTFKKWIDIAKQHNWLVQIRTTPTWLTINRLLSVYDLAWEYNTSIESCNFLDRPEHLRISVLPKSYREKIIESMKHWVNLHENKSVTYNIVNTRNPNTSQFQILQDLKSYINYLETSEYETNLLLNAVEYLKLLESNRKNSILDYLPEYEQLLKSAGY